MLATHELLQTHASNAKIAREFPLIFALAALRRLKSSPMTTFRPRDAGI